MNKRFKIALALLFAALSQRSDATIYAAAKLVAKTGETAYLLSDVPGESDIALMQREALLARAQEPKTALVARDPDDIRRVIDSFSGEARSILQKAQQSAEAKVDGLNSLSPSIITLAYRHDIPVANINYESIMLRKDISVEALKGFINEIFESVQDQYELLTEQDKKEFSYCVAVINDMTQETKNRVSVQNALLDLTAFLERLSIIRVVQGIKEDVSVLLCSKPEDMAFVASHLLREGWEGDASQVIAFGKSWSEKADAAHMKHILWLGEKEAAFAKLQESLKRVKDRKVKQKLTDIYKKQWSVRPASAEGRSNTIACECSNGPIDLKAFFERSQPQLSASSQASSSTSTDSTTGENEQDGAACLYNIADACGRLNHVIAIATSIDLSLMPLERRKHWARQIYNDLRPVITLSDALVSGDAAEQLIAMKIHACELAGYFYTQAELYDNAYVHYANAFAHARGYGVVERSSAPLVRALDSLAQSIKTDEYKKDFIEFLKQQDCDDEEISQILADLERLQ